MGTEPLDGSDDDEMVMGSLFDGVSGLEEEEEEACKELEVGVTEHYSPKITFFV